MANSLAVCSSVWVVDNVGRLSCSGTVSTVDVSSLLQAASVVAFDISQLDPPTIASAFGAGFVLIGFFQVLGIKIAALLRVIRGN